MKLLSPKAELLSKLQVKVDPGDPGSTLSQLYMRCCNFEHEKDVLVELKQLIADGLVEASQQTLNSRRQYWRSGAQAALSDPVADAPDTPVDSPAGFGVPPNAEELSHARLSALEPIKLTWDIGVDMDAINFRLDAVVGEIDPGESLQFLASYLSPEEYRGYLRGNTLLLSMRGDPEDIARLPTFANALARAV